MLLTGAVAAAAANACETVHVKSTPSQRSGNFSSPNFPNPYPADIRCRFVFQGGLNDRIKIEFEHFDLNQIDSAVDG